MTLFWLGIGFGALAALVYLLLFAVPGLIKDAVITCGVVFRAIVKAFREEIDRDREGAPER